MNISKVNLTEKIVAGICVNTNNEKASNLIPKLWDEFYKNNIIDKITHKKDSNLIYGVYSDYDLDNTGTYTITTGVEINRKDIKKYNPVIIKKGKYLLFQNNEKDSTIVDFWDKIYKYFQDNNDIKRRYLSDFEVYENGNNLKIYVGIK